ncbi:MAG: exodeoxyribonuclease VII large subunit [Verrucomicrobia bacterium]|nr:exodeoxyribonuclease VII large subunit [Verrucomicrobiota bacterium]
MSAAETILSVSEITRSIKVLLERAHPQVTLRGEVSNLRYQSSGHIYFTLKDDNAQIKGVIFASAARSLGMRLQEGQSIVGTGRLSLYEPQGSYQIIFQSVQPDGLGRLHAAFEQLKTKLQLEGLFAPERKRKIPVWPRRVGILTSASGAVIRDICSVLQRRSWKGDVFVVPVRVQGSGAAREIADSVRWADENQLFDLLIVARGGGSLEDLWPFNEEILVRAVAACKTPVISAVGHETDFTLSDFTADWRAETPTAAAELLCANLQSFRDRLHTAGISFSQATRNQWQRVLQQGDLMRMRLESQSPQKLLVNWRQRLGYCSQRLHSLPKIEWHSNKVKQHNLALRLSARHPGTLVRNEKRSLLQLAQRLEIATVRGIGQIKQQLQNCSRHLELLSTDSVLQRGFTMTLDATGKVVESAQSVPQSARLTIRFKDGDLDVERS